MAGKVALDPSQKARELSTTSTVDNRLADGRGLSGAADRSRIPSLSLAHVPSFPSRSLIRRLSLRLILSSPSFRMPAPLAPSLSFLFSLRLFLTPIPAAFWLPSRHIAAKRAHGYDGRGTHEVGKHGNHRAETRETSCDVYE